VNEKTLNYLFDESEKVDHHDEEPEAETGSDKE
jgi:hypothetical protein